MAGREGFNGNILDERFPLIGRLSKTIGRPVSVLDTETTGLHDPIGIVEIAVMEVGVDGMARMRQTLVKPDVEIQKGAIEVHGITESMVAESPGLEDLVEDLDDIFRNHVLTGFNSVTYDIPVIRKALRRLSGQDGLSPAAHLDVRDLWRAASGMNRGKLEKVASVYRIEPGRGHRADGDVLTTARILDEMLFHHGLGPVHGAIRIQRGEKGISLPSPDFDAKPEDPADARVLRIIRDWVVRNGPLTPSVYPLVAHETGHRLETFKTILHHLVEKRKIDPELIAVPEAQRVINGHLDNAIEKFGARRLAPIKEYIERFTRHKVDYLQLKIAMNEFKARRKRSAPTGSKGALKEILRNMVRDRVHRTGVFHSDAWNQVVERTGCKNVDLSFAIADLLKSGDIPPEAVADEGQQQILSDHLDEAMRATGETGKLKPLKEYLDKMTGHPVDYTQLRVALMRREAKTTHGGNPGEPQHEPRPTGRGIDGFRGPDPVRDGSPAGPAHRTKDSGDDSSSVPRW